MMGFEAPDAKYFKKLPAVAMIFDHVKDLQSSWGVGKAVLRVPRHAKPTVILPDVSASQNDVVCARSFVPLLMS